MQNIEVQKKAIMKTILKNNLPDIEFHRLADAEHSMLTTLSLYLSKYIDVDLQETSISDR